MQRPAKFLVIASLLVAASVLARAAQVGLFAQPLSEARATIAHSAPARAWRCRDARRPLLIGAREKWKIQYSWTGGYGDGNVWLDLDADGAATLRSHAHREQLDKTNSLVIEPEHMQRIAKAIDDNDLLCLEPIRRDGYVVVDLGRYSVRVVIGGYDKTVYVDDCATVADTEAFRNVMLEIHALEPRLGHEVAWGPHATSSLAGKCPDAS